jgi:hypothetical protein
MKLTRILTLSSLLTAGTALAQGIKTGTNMIMTGGTGSANYTVW